MTEAVVRKGSGKYVFLKISQNLQDDICVGVCFLTKLQVFSLQVY